MSFLSGKIDSRLRFDMADHIALCSSCADEVARCREVWDLMGSWDVPAAPSPQFEKEFWEKNGAEWEREQNKRRGTSRFKWGPSWVPLAMAASLLLVLSWFLFPTAQPVKQPWNLDDGLVNEVLKDPDAVEVILSSFEEVG